MNGTLHRTSTFCSIDITGWVNIHHKNKKTTKQQKKVEKETFVLSSAQRAVCQVIPPSLFGVMYVSQFFASREKKIKLRRKVILATCTMKLIGLVNDKIFTMHCFTAKANGLYYPLRGYSLGSPILNKMESIS